MIRLLCIGFDTLYPKNNAKFVAGGRNFSPRRPVCRSVRRPRPAAEVPKGRVHAGLELDYNKLLDMVSEMGYRLMESGAEIYRVEESIHRLLEAYGVPRGEVFAIPNCIIVSLISPEGRPLTQIRRMPPHGTDIYLLENFKPLLDNRAVSIIHPDILSSGGIYETKKIGDYAEECGVAMALHMAETPVACLAAVHVAAATNNFLGLEFHSNDVDWWSDMVKDTEKPKIVDGFMAVPEKPGIGIDELDDEVLAEHIHPEIPGLWESTDEWNDWISHDRLWS